MSNDRPGEMAASMGNAVEGLPSLLEDTEVQKDIGKNHIDLGYHLLSTSTFVSSQDSTSFTQIKHPVPVRIAGGFKYHNQENTKHHQKTAKCI